MVHAGDSAVAVTAFSFGPFRPPPLRTGRSLPSYISPGLTRPTPRTLDCPSSRHPYASRAQRNSRCHPLTARHPSEGLFRLTNLTPVPASASSCRPRRSPSRAQSAGSTYITGFSTNNTRLGSLGRPSVYTLMDAWPSGHGTLANSGGVPTSKPSSPIVISPAAS